MSIPPDRRRSADIAATTLVMFRAPKAGETLKDCQDAFYALANSRYAVADGVSRSVLPGEWAAILAKHACECGAPESIRDFGQWIEPARRLWDETRRGIVQERPDHYWITGKSSVGASTLMLLEFSHPASGQEITWRAFGVGDSCVFLVRDGRAHMSLPLQNWRDFGRRPSSISTTASPTPLYISFEDRCRVGDRFLLATDALSKWVCAELEQGRTPFETIELITDEQRFRAFIDGERSARRMDNDDVTLVWLKIGPTPSVAMSAPRSQVSVPVTQSVITAPDEAEKVPLRAAVTREAASGTRATGEEVSQMRRVLIGAAVVSALVSIVTSAVYNIGLRHLETAPAVRENKKASSTPLVPVPSPKPRTPPGASVAQTASSAPQDQLVSPQPEPAAAAVALTRAWVMCPQSDCVISDDKKSIRTSGKKVYRADWDIESPEVGKIAPGEYAVKMLRESQHWALIDLTPLRAEEQR